MELWSEDLLLSEDTDVSFLWTTAERAGRKASDVSSVAPCRDRLFQPSGLGHPEPELSPPLQETWPGAGQGSKEAATFPSSAPPLLGCSDNELIHGSFSKKKKPLREPFVPRLGCFFL